MPNAYVNVVMIVLTVITMASAIRVVTAREIEYQRRETLLKIVIAVLGIGTVIAWESIGLTLGDYIIAGGTLILVRRELQNSPTPGLDIVGCRLRHRLAALVGGAAVLVVFIHSPWAVKLILAGLMLVILIRKRGTRTERVREAPEPAVEETAQETEQSVCAEDNVIQVNSDATHAIDPEQVTASYAHPSTGMAHTDAALQVYVSSDEGSVKARARRIIIAGLTRTAAFRTEDEGLDEALRDIVMTGDPAILKDRLQVLPERLTDLAKTEADRLDPIKQKVLTVLNIVRIIAEDQEKQTQVQAAESLIKTMDA